jgi:hypothetical protein
LQVSGERDFFAAMVVEAVTKLDPETLDLRMLGIKKVQVGELVRWGRAAPLAGRVGVRCWLGCVGCLGHGVSLLDC